MYFLHSFSVNALTPIQYLMVKELNEPKFYFTLFTRNIFKRNSFPICQKDFQKEN